MGRLWTYEEELSAIALGELMNEWLIDHPGDDDAAAFDAVCFRVGQRMKEIQSTRFVSEAHYV